jgi:tRNA (guanine-N1)-methyltransferase
VRIDIVTLFPGMLEAPLAESIVGRARARGLVDIRVHDLRAHAAGRHRVTDEPPFGGGGGMILKPEPLAAAVEALKPEAPTRGSSCWGRPGGGSARTWRESWPVGPTSSCSAGGTKAWTSE